MTFDQLHREIQRALRRDHDRARALVRRFARRAARTGTPVDKAMAWFERAQLEHVGSRLGKARHAYRTARAAFARLREPRRVLAADLGAVIVEAHLGERKSVGKTARRIRRRAVEPLLAAAAELSIGSAMLHLGDATAAERAFRTALARAPRTAKAPAPLLRAQARLNLSICLARRGRHARARRELDTAEQVFTDLGADTEVDAVRHTRGWVLGLGGEAKGALDALDEAAATFSARKDPVGVALVGLDRAHVLAWMGDFAAAADAARVARRLLRRKGRLVEAARADLAVGHADRAAGRTRRARGAARRALEVFREAGDQAGAAMADVLLGQRLARAEATLRARGFWMSAVDAVLQRARALPPARGVRLLEERMREYPRALMAWLKPDLFRIRSRVAGAARIPLLRRALRAAEDARQRAPTVRLRATTLASHLDIYADFAAALLERGSARDRREAFVVLDAVRARTLREEAEHSGASFDRPAVRVLRKRLEGLWRVLERDEASPSDLRLSRVEALREAAACERALMVEMRASAPGPARSYVPGLPRAPTLAFSVLRDRVVGLLAKRGQVTTWDCGPLLPLRHALEAFRFHVTRRLFGSEDVAPAEAHLAELSSRLLGEAPPLPTRRIVVVLPPQLGSIPVEALPYRGAPLCERTVIVHAPCACLRPRPVRTAGRALVVGIGGTGLPEVTHEVAFVARAVGDATVLEGAAADRDSVLGAVRGKRLIHVAAHAQAREDIPPLSALRVHNGWLAAADLVGGLEGAVVVLSGCRTGDPALRWHGEGMAGFPRALLAAGAGAVVASRWELADDIAHRWMRLFYEEARGQGTAAAVAAAARRMRRRFPHPADWAAFLWIQGVR